MSELSFFLAPNVEKAENVKLAVSRRFKDGEGKPVLWEFRPFSADEDDILRKKHTKRIQVPGKKNQFAMDFDANGYLAEKIAIQCVYPDLRNAELQNSWGVVGEVNLLKVMLTSDEFQELAGNLSEAFQTETLADKVEDAKN